jgi:charged multivesicular body protein 4
MMGKSGATVSPQQAKKTIVNRINELAQKETMLRSSIAVFKKTAEVAHSRKNIAERNLALKKRIMCERQMELTSATASNLMHQLMVLESAESNLDTVRAMKHGASALRTIQKDTSVSEVAETMDEISQAMTDASDINTAMSQPLAGGVDESDMDDALAELEESLQEENDRAYEQMFDKIVFPTVPGAKSPEKPVHRIVDVRNSTITPVRLIPVRSADEELLQKLMAEMNT